MADDREKGPDFWKNENGPRTESDSESSEETVAEPSEKKEDLTPSLEVFEPKHRRGENEGSRFKLGIIGGHSSGKSSYIYTLGRLKVDYRKPLKDWEIGAFTPKYQKFFANMNTSNIQRTPFDKLNIFEMFPVVKNSLEINLQAFDAAGENFVAAVSPAQYEKIPKGTERFKVVRTLQKEILSCDGFIFLVDSEMSFNRYRKELKEENPAALLPELLLLYFSDFLKNQSGKRVGQIHTPIAFVLTKADCVSERDGCRLDYFNEVKISSSSYKIRDNVYAANLDRGQQEAREFLKIKFHKLCNQTDTFSNNFFSAISCWGHEPDFMIEDPKGSGKMREIQREEVAARKKEGTPVIVAVNDIRPVCIADPLYWLLGEMETKADRIRREVEEEKRRRHESQRIRAEFERKEAQRRREAEARRKEEKRKNILKFSICLVLLALLYPFLTFLAGIGADTLNSPRLSKTMYFISESSPLFKIDALAVRLADKYIALAYRDIEHDTYDTAKNGLSRAQSILSDNQSQGSEWHGHNLRIANGWLSLSRIHLKNNEFDALFSCLKVLETLIPNDPGIRDQRISIVLGASRAYLEKGQPDHSTKLIIPLFEWAMSTDDVSGSMQKEINTQTSAALTALINQLETAGQYDSAIERLKFCLEHRQALGIDETDLKLDIVYASLESAKRAFKEQNAESGTGFIRQAVKYLTPGSAVALDATTQMIDTHREQIGLGRSIGFLKTLSTYPGSGSETESRIRATICALAAISAKQSFDQQNTEKGIALIDDAIKHLSRGNAIGFNKIVELVQTRNDQIGFDRTVNFLKTLIRHPASNPRTASTIRGILTDLALLPMQQNDTTATLSRIRSVFREIPGDREIRGTLENWILEYSQRFASNQKRLQFIDNTIHTLGRYSDITRVEAATVFEISRSLLAKGNPDETIELLTDRSHLRESWRSKYDALHSHAQKALSMAFIPGQKGQAGYYLDRYETSNGDYRKELAGKKITPPLHWQTRKYQKISPDDDSPVIYVSWKQAENYAGLVGKRLPSVVEWEWAWGTKTYPWGNQFAAGQTNTSEFRKNRTAARDEKILRNDHSPYGVYGLAGNVAEFTADTMMWKGKERATVKGGSFIYEKDKALKSENAKIVTDAQNGYVGFRCAMDATPDR